MFYQRLIKRDFEYLILYTEPRSPSILREHDSVTKLARKEPLLASSETHVKPDYARGARGVTQ